MSKGKKLFGSARNWGCGETQRQALLLFVQRTRELLLHTTSMSAKPLFASPLVIAREISTLLRQNLKAPHTSAESNLKLLCDELGKAIKFDDVARALIGGRLDHLTSALCDFSNSQHQIEIAAFLSSRLKPQKYTVSCAKTIIEIVEEGGKRKKELLLHTEAYVAAIKECGYPTQTIYHLLNVTFLERERTVMTARERLEKFFSNFDFEIHTYNVVFGINDVINNITMGFEAIGGKYSAKGTAKFGEFINEISAGNERFFTENLVDGIVKFEDVKALDPQSARTSAERRLRLLDDLLRFSVHRRRFIVNNQALVQIEKDKSYINSNRPRSPILLVPHETEAGHEDLFPLAKALGRIKSSSGQRYIRAIELHGTALSAQEYESQLLNVWIAFETLFVTGRYGSKIREIVEAVQPYVLTSWSNYVLGELWERIQHIHLKRWSDAIAGVPELVDRDGFHQFVLCVAVRKYEPAMTKFLGQLDEDPLLRQKICACIDWTQSAKQIHEYVEQIKVKISYDLNRIYRLRNQIVHTGARSDNNLADIVQLAHHYLDMVLTVLSMLLGADNGCDSIEQANFEAQVSVDLLTQHLRTEAGRKVKCDDDNCFSLLFCHPAVT